MTLEQGNTEWAEKLAGRSRVTINQARIRTAKGLVLPTGSVRSITLTLQDPQPNTPLETTFELAAGPEEFAEGYSYAPFDALDLPPGEYEILADGTPCMSLGFSKELREWLFVLDANCPLVVTESWSGCFGGGSRARVFLRDGDGFRAADGGRLSFEQVDELRARVLASRPGPGQSRAEILAHPDSFLRELGFTDEVVASHLHQLRAKFAEDWRNHRTGVQESNCTELDSLVTLERVKHDLAEHLTIASNNSTQTYARWIEIPGDPWVCLASEADSPDLIPWYAGIPGQHWHVLDRELSRSLLALGQPDGEMQRRLAASEDWRATLWSEARAWPELGKQADEALTRSSYQLVPGWEQIAQRFELVELLVNPHASSRLPTMKLRVLEPGSIDQVSVVPASSDPSDWNDVRADFERVEALVSANPWFARGKQQDSSLRLVVSLPAGIDRLVDAPSIRTAWSEIVAEGEPEFVLFFSFVVPMGNRSLCTVGTACLSRTGTVLIVDSTGSRGPLASVAPNGSRLRDTGRYGLVRPDGTLEIGQLER